MPSQATRTSLENQFIRQFPVPLDSTAVFPLTTGVYAGFTKQQYLEDVRTSGLAYIGMIIADTSDNEVYVLDSNRQWKEVGVTVNQTFGASSSGLLFKTGNNTFSVGGLNAGTNIEINNPSGLLGNPTIGVSLSLTGLNSIAVTGSDGISSSGTLTVASGVTFRNNLNVNGSGNFLNGLYSNGVLVSVSGHQHIASDVTNFSEAVQDVLGDGNFLSTGFLRNGSGLAWTYDDQNNTLSARVTGIPVSLITDLDNYINNTIDTSLVEGNGIGLTYDSNTGQLAISVTGVSASLVQNINNVIIGTANSLISGNILAGTGINLNYNNSTSKLTINSNIVGVSGVKVDHDGSSNKYTISLNDPTIQAADVTDFSEAVDDRVASLINATNGLVSSYIDNNDRLDIALDNTVVRTTGNQNITGDKSFSLSNVSIDMSEGGSFVVNNNGASISLFPGLSPTVGGAGATSLISTASSVGADLYLPDSNGTIALVSDISGILASRNLIAGNGLSGGGALSSGVRFDIGQGDGISVSANGIAVNSTVVRTTGVQTVSGIKTFADNISLNGNRITNLAIVPVSNTDAASKGYVDSIKQGLDIKDSVRVATTENISLDGDGYAIDGIMIAAGDRVLVKDQNDPRQNGIYIVDSEEWSRSDDANTTSPSTNSDSDVTPGLFVFVEEGNINADSGWVLTTDGPITLDFTNLYFSQFSGAGQITAGSGLTKTGNTLNIGGTVGTIVVNADNITLDTVTRTNSGSSAGLTFLSSIITDSYGRVTASSSGVVQDASASVKGIASFDSNSFNVNTGVVSIKNSGINNSQLEYNYIQLGNVQQTLGSTYNSLVGLSSISGVSVANPTILTFCVIDGGTP